MHIPFNKPHYTGIELDYLGKVCASDKFSGDGPFSRRCEALLSQMVGCKKALLTHSCTAALEMAAILIDIKPDDEVILPSYTFVSTASAFVLRGAVPVFVDIRSDTLNIDETLIEGAITPKTKAIVIVHYAGIACNMEKIVALANKYNLYLIEDAAQAIMSTYKNKPLGSYGHLAAFSFHDTKNIISGEGGALLINDAQFIKTAEIIREKGTNRNQFLRGEIDKYTWVDLGSSFLPSEFNAAYLLAQLEQAVTITQRRLNIWNHYHQIFDPYEQTGIIARPTIPQYCQHNAHMYYVLFKNLQQRTRFIDLLKQKNINAFFHYVPLHDSPAGLKYGRSCGDMRITKNLSEQIVRLPLWIGLEEHWMLITEAIHSAMLVINSE